MNRPPKTVTDEIWRHSEEEGEWNTVAPHTQREGKGGKAALRGVAGSLSDTVV